MGSQYLTSVYGAEVGVNDPNVAFGSKGEQALYYALAQRIGRESFVFGARFGDIPTTPGREERSAEFVIPALDAVILVNSEFTHPDPAADQVAKNLIESLGYRVYFLWDYEILPEQGGSPEGALDKIPGLGFYGQADSKKRADRTKRTYGQPPRIAVYRAFGRWTA